MARKRGLLITNHFLNSAYLESLYRLLSEAAEKMAIELSHTTGGAFMREIAHSPAAQADFVLFWDKDVSLARRLVRHGIPVFNTPDAIRICDDKAETAEALLRAGLPTPRTLYAPLSYPSIGCENTDFVKDACQTLGLPLVIKECFGSFGEQVHLAHTLAEAEALAHSLGGRRFLFQELIRDSFGVDLRVNVVGDKAVCAMRREGRAGDFRSNIAAGGSGTAYPLSEREAALAVAAAKAVGADFAGVDLLFAGEGRLVCEVNSNPHFLGSYAATGVDLAPHIFSHILQRI